MHHHHSLLAHPESIFLALAAATMYGLTSVLQHSAASKVDAKHSMRPGLVLQLVRRPRWLLGNLTDLAAVILQFLALRRGALLVVQSLLVAGLLFTLPAAAAVQRRRLQAKEWLSALGLVTGLAVFLAVANPTRGRAQATGGRWIAVIVITAAAVALLVLRAPKESGRARARRLGAASGVVFALTAALAKGSGQVLTHGLYEAVTSWEPYTWLIIASAGFLLAQSALHAGPLDASMPMVVIADPGASALIGILAFHERIAIHPMAAAIEVASVAMIVLSVFTLTRSRVEAGLDEAEPVAPGGPSSP
ncbi:MAG: DMT family transporter [Actinomycetota bacterium]|nr:DMT family transporter [Actinomycetota bacterium]